MQDATLLVSEEGGEGGEVKEGGERDSPDVLVSAESNDVQPLEL